MRECSSCNLCCRLLPVPQLNKPAGQRCKHQSFAKGCRVYRTAKFPASCALWNCRWLVNDDCDDLSRPDRSHYVIDVMPDFITTRDDATGETRNIQVVQIWIDPKHPEAHKDPALRRYLFRRAEQGIAGLIRFSTREGFVIFAPPFDVNGQWHVIKSDSSGRSHSLAEITEVLQGAS
jgi:hypothetical protein